MNASCPWQTRNIGQKMKSPDVLQRTWLLLVRKSSCQICCLKTFIIILWLLVACLKAWKNPHHRYINPRLCTCSETFCLRFYPSLYEDSSEEFFCPVPDKSLLCLFLSPHGLLAATWQRMSFFIPFGRCWRSYFRFCPIIGWITFRID